MQEAGIDVTHVFAHNLGYDFQILEEMILSTLMEMKMLMF